MKQPSVLKIGQASKALGVSIDTLRRWEASGKINAERTAGGTRVYSPFVKIGEAAQVLGVSIDTLRRWERAGKIAPVRTPGSTRLYSLDELRKISPTTSVQSTSELLQKKEVSQLPKEDSQHFSHPVALETLIKQKIDDRFENLAEPSPKPKKIYAKIYAGVVLCLILALLIGPIGLIRQMGLIGEKLKAKSEQPVVSDVLAASSIAQVGKYLEVNADTIITGNLAVNGESIFGEGIIGKSTLSIAGVTTLSTTSINSTLSVTGLTTATGGLTTPGKITLTGNEKETLLIKPTSDPSSATKLFVIQNAAGTEKASINSSGATTLSSTLEVKGGTTLSSTISVSGAATLSGATTLSSSLEVSGTTTLSGSSTLAGATTISSAGAASTPGLKLTGAWYTGGSTTTSKPQLLVEPTDITSTGWSASGTGIGVNAKSSFTGNLLDLQLAGVSKFSVDYQGNISAAGAINFSGLTASRAVFTDASSNLTTTGASAALLNALSDETGTGVAVFGTSPTITTSLLTDSTSFNLLNTTATTVNFAGAATTISIAATTGTTTINNNTTLGDATSDTITFTARIASGSSLIPAVSGGSDLGTSSLKFNNLYVNTVNASSGSSTSGQAIFTYQPTTTAIAEGTIYVNPTTTPVANVSLVSVAVGGVEKARINSNGYLGLNGANDPGSTYIINAGSNFQVDTSGNTTLGGDLAVNGATSADITTTTTTATIFNTTATTLSIGGAATTLNIGLTGSDASSIVMSGGSADTGCTLNGATGDLTCAGNITGSSSGTAGFWSRTAPTLSPATAGDNVSIGAISAAGTNNFGLSLSTLTGGTATNYQITTGVLTSATTTTNAQINLGGVVTTGGTTNYGINVGALSGSGTTNYGINITALTSTGTTNAALNIGGLSGAGTNNYGIQIQPVTGAGTANVALCFDCDGTWTSSTVASGIQFGSDANAVTLYRNGSDLLQTDDAFTATGNITTSGDLAVNGATSADITTTTTTATLFNTTATTLSIGGAATTFNIGTTDSVTRTINLGTGSGADTINIGTGGTTADALTFGNTGVATTFTFNSGATTQTALSLATASLTTGEAMDITATSTPTAGGTQSVIDLNFANAPTGTANTMRGVDIAVTDATSLANTVYGLYVDTNVANTSATKYAAGFNGGTVLQTPTNPTYVGGLSFAEAGWKSVVVGRYLYTAFFAAAAGTCSAADSTGCEVRIFDITTPSAPVFVGGADTGGTAASNIFVAGRYMYVSLGAADANTCNSTTNTGCEIQIYDISNPSSPTVAGGINTGLAMASGYGYGMFVSGKFLYTQTAGATAGTCNSSDSSGCEIQIYDISNPGSPSFVGGADNGGNSAANVYLQGRYLYAVNAGNIGTCDSSTNTGCEFQIYDVSSPSNPTYVGGANLVDNSQGLTISGRYAYISVVAARAGTCSSSDNTGCEAFIYDIANPTSPTFVGGIDIGKVTRQMIISGRYLYLTTTNNTGTCDSSTSTGCEVQIYDVSTPASPTYMGGADMGSAGNATGAVLSGRYLFANRGTATGTCSSSDRTSCEIQVFDVSGVEATSVIANSLESGSLMVRENAIFNNQVYAQGGLTVGINGMLSQGTIGGNVSTASTTADTILAGDFATTTSGIITTGTRSIYGLRSQPSSTAASTGGTTNVYGLYSKAGGVVGAGGTINSYGLYVANDTMDTTGTSANYGLYIENPTGADTNYALYTAGGNSYFATTQTVASGASATLDAFNIPASTITVSGSTNITTATGFNLVNIGQPTYSNATIAVTNAATLYIANAPTASGGGSITNPYALWVDAGASRFDGQILALGGNQVAAPSYSFNGDSDTGIYAQSADRLDFAMAGVLRYSFTPSTFQIDRAAVSGGATGINLIGVAHTAITAEKNTMLIGGDQHTITGGYTNQRFTLFNQPGISAASALTVANAATVHILAAPAAQGSALITNSVGLRIGSDGAGSGTTNSYSIYTDAMTGGINNYAASFNGGNVGIGTASPGGQLNIAGNISASAWGLNGIQFRGDAATYTDSSTASGTVTNAVFASLAQPTLAATNASITTTNAATFYIANAPTAGTNMTITNPYALWVDAGASRFDGPVAFGAQQTLTANSTTPSVSAGSHFITANTTDPTLISNFTSGHNGQILVIELGDSVTDFDCTASNLNCGGADITTGATGDIFTFVYDGTNWNMINWMDTSATQTGADIAEWYVSSEALEPGDVVSITPQEDALVEKSKTSYDQKAMGIVTTAPGIVLGEETQFTFAVALAGRVPVKVSTENGPIEKGDYLTSSSTPGVAMKAIKPGPVVGKALEAFSANTSEESGPTSEVKFGKILTFVNVSFADPSQALANLLLDEQGNLVIPKVKTASLEIGPIGPISPIGEVQGESTALDVASKLKILDETIATQSAYLTQAKAEIASASAELAKTKSDIDLLKLTPPEILLATGSATLANIKATDTLSSEKLLTALDVTVSGVFKALGESFMGNTTIAGNLVVDGTFSISGNSINVIGLDTTNQTNGILYLQNNSLSQGLDILNGKFIFDKTGKLTVVGTVEAEQFSVTSGKSAGSAKILAGQTEIIVENEFVTENSLVLLTPEIPLSQTLAITNKTNKTNLTNAKFTVKLNHTEAQDITFSYLIIGQNQKVNP